MSRRCDLAYELWELLWWLCGIGLNNNQRRP